MCPRCIRWLVPLAVALAAPILPARAQPADRSASDSEAATDDAVVVDRVVAAVNDEIILFSELMQRVAPMAIELERISDTKERARRQAKLKTQTLDEMINDELMVQAAVESKLEVSAKEVQNALDEIKKQNNLEDNQLTEALRMQGYSMATYRKDLRRQILRMRAVNTLVRPKVSISDDEVRAKFDSLNRRSAGVSEVRLQHILIAVPERPTDEQISAAKARAADLINKARAGGNFTELARKHSDDTATAASGGDLGWIARGSIATEWELIVFSMAKGEVRGPVSGPQGLHVFHVSDVRRTERQAFDEVKEQLRNELFRQEMDRQTRLWVDDLRKKAHVDVLL